MSSSTMDAAPLQDALVSPEMTLARVADSGLGRVPLSSDSTCALEEILLAMKGPQSKWAQVEPLVRAERLHGGTKHGGDRRKQDATLASCSFVEHVHRVTGIPRRTVSRRLKSSRELANLDPAAAGTVPGSWLANDVALLLRVAALPLKELHQEVLRLFVEGNREVAEEELKKWEMEFGLTKQEPSQDSPEEGDVAPEAPEVAPTVPLVPSALAEVLGTDEPEKAVATAKRLQEIAHHPLHKRLAHLIAKRGAEVVSSFLRSLEEAEEEGAAPLKASRGVAEAGAVPLTDDERELIKVMLVRENRPETPSALALAAFGPLSPATRTRAENALRSLSDKELIREKHGQFAIPTWGKIRNRLNAALATTSPIEDASPPISEEMQRVVGIGPQREDAEGNDERAEHETRSDEDYEDLGDEDQLPAEDE